MEPMMGKGTTDIWSSHSSVRASCYHLHDVHDYNTMRNEIYVVLRLLELRLAVLPRAIWLQEI